MHVLVLKLSDLTSCTVQIQSSFSQSLLYTKGPITQPPVVIFGRDVTTDVTTDVTIDVTRDVTNRNICLLLRCDEVNAFSTVVS